MIVYNIGMIFSFMSCHILILKIDLRPTDMELESLLALFPYYQVSITSTNQFNIVNMLHYDI